MPALRQARHSEELWLRSKAAEALAAIGQPAMVAVPEMLEALARCDTQKDPRGMQQRFFTFALFDSRHGLLGRSLEGVDRQALYQAVQAGLKNEDGRARSDLRSAYQLERIAADFSRGERDFPRTHSLQKANTIREAIRAIESSTERPELIRLQ